MKSIFKIITFLIFGIIVFFLSDIIFAQTTTSNCVVTRIGGILGEPELPPECQVFPSGELIAPPNMECLPNGYCKLPESEDNAYIFNSQTPEDERWGTRELVSVLYTVAQQWKSTYPSGKIYIGDLTAFYGHKSHKTGIDVDLSATTNGVDWVADFTKGNYNQKATVVLGKLFAKTGLISIIFYNDIEANKAVLDFSPEANPSSGMSMIQEELHDNHFHIRLNVAPLCSVGPNC